MIILTISNTNPILKINPNKDNTNDKDNLHKCAIMWSPHQLPWGGRNSTPSSKAHKDQVTS